MLKSLHAAELEQIIRFQQIAIPEVVMKALSNLGPSAYLMGLLGLIYLCGNATLGARLLLVYFGSEVLSYWTKLAFHSPRPFWMDERVHAFEPNATSYGLPSGHSLVATCVWFMLARSVQKSWFWLISLAVVLLISLSRVWLGAHFASDVAAGWVLGGAFIVLFVWAERRFRQFLIDLSLRSQILWSVLVALTIVSIGLALHSVAQNSVDPTQWPRYPAITRSFRSAGSYAGAILGLGIGLAMAARWARFDAGGRLTKRFLRILILAAGATLYWLRPRNLLKDMPDLLGFSLLLVACTMAAWGFTFLVPWFFLRIGLAERSVPTAPSASFPDSTLQPKAP
ncbi:MAG: phosphatase PAP2 family protein [Verrucomicrobiales bacterium]|nr:phosphatase PAP2 family protein [Verrucomicrobiales bacterium]